METSVKKLIEKLDKAANDMKDIGCGIISIICFSIQLIFYVILLAGIIIYCIILLGALFG